MQACTLYEWPLDAIWLYTLACLLAKVNVFIRWKRKCSARLPLPLLARHQCPSSIFVISMYVFTCSRLHHSSLDENAIERRVKKNKKQNSLASLTSLSAASFFSSLAFLFHSTRIVKWSRIQSSVKRLQSSSVLFTWNLSFDRRERKEKKVSRRVESEKRRRREQERKSCKRGKRREKKCTSKKKDEKQLIRDKPIHYHPVH